MSQKIAVIIDPLDSLNPKKDTTLYLMKEAIDRGHQVFIATVDGCFIKDGIAYANLTELKNADERTVGHTKTTELSECDLILMRKDPPFDMHYVYVTYILELAEKAGARVINKPQSLRDCNEKIFITQFPDCITDTLVSSSTTVLWAFLDKHKKIVLKTLNDMGGAGVSLMEQSDFPSKAEAQTHLDELVKTNGHIMAQTFLPEVYDGDKRIILFDGEPLPYAVVRLPKENEFRANLAQGGHYKIAPLTKRDRWLCAQIKDEIKTRDLFFVGLDVIGDFITEINVTSPTCLRELANDSDINPAAIFWDKLLGS